MFRDDAMTRTMEPPAGSPAAVSPRMRRLASPPPWLSFDRMFTALVVLHVLPVWIMPHFPTQDGAAHLYNAHLLTELLSQTNFQLRQLYTIDYQLHPNILVHVVLAGLLKVFPPGLAEKIVQTCILALLPVSMLYLVRSIGRGGEVFSLAGFLFAYNNLFFRGFYNFNLGVGLMVLTLGWWWRRRDAMTIGVAAGLNALVIVTYVAHFVAFLGLLATLFAAAVWFSIRHALVALLDPAARSGPRIIRDIVAPRARNALALAGCLLPAMALAVDYNLRTRGSGIEYFRPPGFLREVFTDTLLLASFSDWHLRLTPFVLGVFVLGLLATVVQRLLSTLRTATPLHALPRLLEDRDALLIVSGMFTLLFFMMPYWRNAGGSINERLYLMAFVLAWCWIGGVPRWLNRGLGVALVALGLLHTGRLTWEAFQLQPDLREMTAATHLVEPHSTLGTEIDTQVMAGLPASNLRFSPLLHTFSLYGLGRDIGLFENYAAGLPYFMTRWGSMERIRPDYMLLWGDTTRLHRYEADYEVIHKSRHLRLIRLRRHEPDLSAWHRRADGRRVLRLRMLEHDSDDGTSIIDVPHGHLHTSGSWGWVRSAPPQQWRTERTGPYSAMVAARAPRAFQVDLPDGRYRVRLHFLPHPEGHYRVNVSANDRRVISELVVRRRWPASVSYDVDVTDGRLLHVFSSDWQPRPDQRQLRIWAVAGIEIEELAADVRSEPGS
jgi:hypothetical protein